VEAEVSGSALLELLTATGAGSTALAGARDAGATLRSDVEQAADLAALQTARARFVERVCGRASSSGGLLGGVLGGTVGLVGGLLDGVLGLVTQLSANLEQNLSLDLAALARADSCGGTDNGQGTELSLSKLARTLAGFAEDVRTSAVGSKSGSAKADAEALAKLVATAQLTLRAAR
jgi:hypothetical protein